MFDETVLHITNQVSDTTNLLHPPSHLHGPSSISSHFVSRLFYSCCCITVSFAYYGFVLLSYFFCLVSACGLSLSPWGGVCVCVCSQYVPRSYSQPSSFSHTPVNTVIHSLRHHSSQIPVSNITHYKSQPCVRN